MTVNAVTVAEAKRVAKEFVGLCEAWEALEKKEQTARQAAQRSASPQIPYPYHWTKPAGTAAALKRRSHDLRVVLAELRRSA